MLELIFLSPLLAVAIGAVITRFIFRRRPFAARGWAIIATLLIGAFCLPLPLGVWPADFIGTVRTLASATSSSGYALHVTQAWNYCDFYTTTLDITAPDGSTTAHTLDGDDSKNWSVSIALDEGNRVAKVTLSGGRLAVVRW